MKAARIVAIVCFCTLASLHAEVRSDAREAALRYEEAFALVGSLPGDPEKFVRTATRDQVAKLERALDLLQENAGAESVDWGVDWARAETLGALDQLGQIRKLANLGVAYHEEKLKRGVSDRFAADIMALLGTARHVTEGQPLIYFLTSLAVEGIVRDAVAKNATQLPPEIRDEILQEWQARPPARSMVEVLKTERLISRGGFWSMFAHFKENWVGGLAEDIEVNSNEVDAEGILGVDFEETRTGEAFRLRPGERHDNVELVFVDVEMGRALLRRGDESAIVDLEARTMQPIDLDAAWSGLFGDNAEFDNLLEQSGGDKARAFKAFLDFHDAEAEGLVRFLTTSYAELPEEDEIVEGLSEFGKITAPVYLRVRESVLGSQAFEELLLAGLNQLKEPGAPLPVSEVTGDPIVLEMNYEALTLQSSFLIRGEPMQLKFPRKGH